MLYLDTLIQKNTKFSDEKRTTVEPAYNKVNNHRVMMCLIIHGSKKKKSQA